MSRMNILEMVNFETIVNSFWPLTITAKLFILDACGGPRYTCAFDVRFQGN